MKQLLRLFLLIFWALLVQTVNCQTPVAHYSFNGNADDSGPNSLNGTLIGNPTLTTDLAGNANSAYLFDGIDDHVDIGTSLLLKPTTALTVSLWAYNTNWASFSDWAALCGNASSGGYDLVIHGSAGTMESQVRYNGDYQTASYPLSSISSGWHHFALTCDGRYNIIYIDGAAIDTYDAGAVYPIQYTYTGNHTLIGAEAGTVNTEGDYFSGKIDEAAIYDVALNSAQILLLYTSYLGINDNSPEKLNIDIYPNPVSDILNISGMKNMAGFTAEVFDITGRKQAGVLNQSCVPMNFVNPGVYFLRITQNGYSYIQKVIKQ